jgi:hypothetical protein
MNKKIIKKLNKISLEILQVERTFSENVLKSNVSNARKLLEHTSYILGLRK